MGCVASSSVCEVSSQKDVLVVVFLCLACPNQMPSVVCLKEGVYFSQLQSLAGFTHDREREGERERERERETESASKRALVSSFLYKDTNSIMRGSIPTTSSQPDYLPKDPSPNAIMLEVRILPYELQEGTQFSPQILPLPPQIKSFLHVRYRHSITACKFLADSSISSYI